MGRRDGFSLFSLFPSFFSFFSLFPPSTSPPPSISFPPFPLIQTPLDIILFLYYIISCLFLCSRQVFVLLNHLPLFDSVLLFFPLFSLLASFKTRHKKILYSIARCRFETGDASKGFSLFFILFPCSSLLLFVMSSFCTANPSSSHRTRCPFFFISFFKRFIASSKHPHLLILF